MNLNHKGRIYVPQAPSDPVIEAVAKQVLQMKKSRKVHTRQAVLEAIMGLPETERDRVLAYFSMKPTDVPGMFTKFRGALYRVAADPTPPASPKPKKAKQVTCSVCGKKTDAATAHRHQGKLIGDECWDERLRTTE